MLDLYVFLKIPQESTQEEVEAAHFKFRERISSFAPGINVSEEDLEKEFPEVSHGFNLLRDPLRRAEYDGLLLKRSYPQKQGTQIEPIAEDEVLTFRQRIGLAIT